MLFPETCYPYSECEGNGPSNNIRRSVKFFGELYLCFSPRSHPNSNFSPLHPPTVRSCFLPLCAAYGDREAWYGGMTRVLTGGVERTYAEAQSPF